MNDDESIEQAGLPDIVRDDTPGRGTRRRDRLTALARRTADRARDARESPIGQWLEARARDAADRALSRESVETVQSGLAMVANFGISRARKADPDADLLLDMLAWLENRHGRELVARTFAHNTPVLKRSWMKLVQSVATPGRHEATAADVKVVRDETAALLGELAGLEHPEPPPKRADQLIDYFESEWIPRRFLPLAERVAGVRRRRDTESAKESAPRTGGALARFVPSLEDPTIAFMVSSLLAVSNAYMTRELLERLPDIVEMIRDET